MTAASRARHPLRSWVLTNGVAGSETQCFGIADALGLEPERKRVRLRGFRRFIAPYGPAAPDDSIRPPWPDILIASGRVAIPYARHVRKAANGTCFTVVLQNPRVSPKHFDLVWAPDHDRLRGDNVISTLTSPHHITQARLDEAARACEASYAHIPHPRLAVLLGGPSSAFPFRENDVMRLADALNACAKVGAGLLITSSRRTPKTLMQRLRAMLDPKRAVLWDGTGENPNAGPNPYMGFLALADSILVSCDSVNMVGEACATGKPVYVFPLVGGTPKFDRFFDALLKEGAVRVFDGRLEKWDAVRLNATETIAQRIREVLGKTKRDR